MTRHSVVFAVGSPERLVEYERLPGCFVHPVPKYREARVCFVYKKKLEILCQGLHEMWYYTMVFNGRGTVVYFDILNLQWLAQRLLRTLTKMCKDHKKMSRPVLRECTIAAVNHFRVLCFRVHRMIWCCRKILNRCSSQFPIRSC